MLYDMDNHIELFLLASVIDRAMKSEIHICSQTLFMFDLSLGQEAKKIIILKKRE